MEKSTLRQRLDAGEVAYGVITAWPDPDLVEAAGRCGFDWLFIDAEHGALDIRTCVELVRAADCAGMTSLVRVPYGDVRGVYPYLDLGAHGLIFPHIRTAADAQEVVHACLFPKDGLRGAMSSSRAARSTAAATRSSFRTRRSRRVGRHWSSSATRGSLGTSASPTSTSGSCAAPSGSPVSRRSSLPSR